MSPGPVVDELQYAELMAGNTAVGSGVKEATSTAETINDTFLDGSAAQENLHGKTDGREVEEQLEQQHDIQNRRDGDHATSRAAGPEKPAALEDAAPTPGPPSSELAQEPSCSAAVAPSAPECPPNCDPTYRMPDELQVTVAVGDEVRNISVRVERSGEVKLFQGGYRHKSTGRIYHHACTQAGRREQAVKRTDHLRTRDTQTFMVKTRTMQTTNECGTQVRCAQRLQFSPCQRCRLVISRGQRDQVDFDPFLYVVPSVGVLPAAPAIGTRPAFRSEKQRRSSGTPIDSCRPSVSPDGTEDGFPKPLDDEQGLFEAPAFSGWFPLLRSDSQMTASRRPTGRLRTGQERRDPQPDVALGRAVRPTRLP